MTENNIELKSVEELLGMNFYIPSYQRGYRWTQQQVNDLLNDIDDYINKSKFDSFYCLQPLVVKSREQDVFNLIKHTANTLVEIKNLLQGSWEVIDGQQRLTTIYILLSYLSSEKYSIEYETRESSKEFLGNISQYTAYVNKADDCDKEICTTNETTICKGLENLNIDYYYILTAKNTIEKWFNNKGEQYDKTLFTKTLLKEVQFIWYESVNEDPIKVFTRLNIGKIGLTNSELIKALFLNRSNFSGDDSEKIRLKQYEIASQWDIIEYTLQNNEFWLFIHKKGYDKPTRIEFIFDLMCENGTLNQFLGGKSKTIGSDKFTTFRYFNAYFSTARKEGNDKSLIEQCWGKISKIFQTFVEWFNDLELYHYIGFLIEYNHSIFDLYNDWENAENKDIFLLKLKEYIRKEISQGGNLNNFYEIDKPDGKGKYPDKTVCKPVLLLHNIQTVINQNKSFEAKQEYELGVFYKFPFHLYKKENWDVEHIDSNEENEINDKATQNEFLINVYNAADENDKRKIEEFISNSNASNFSDFNKYKNLSSDKLDDNEKNQICNFTLLDSSTNRSYGNSIFAAKRRIIIGKDCGQLLPIPKIKTSNNQTSLQIGKKPEKAKTSFIPPCTMHIFLKYYSTIDSASNYWTKTDADAYKLNIADTLKDFGVINEPTKNGDEK